VDHAPVPLVLEVKSYTQRRQINTIEKVQVKEDYDSVVLRRVVYAVVHFKSINKRCSSTEVCDAVVSLRVFCLRRK
jgi:hypothetical protein